jgi:hypothetical protein
MRHYHSEYTDRHDPDLRSDVWEMIQIVAGDGQPRRRTQIARELSRYFCVYVSPRMVGCTLWNEGCGCWKQDSDWCYTLM